MQTLVKTKKEKKDKISESKKLALRRAVEHPIPYLRKLFDSSFYYFLRGFWDEISTDEFKDNWHIKYLCEQLEEIAYRVANKEPKKHDLVINISPGTTKTIICSIMFPVWCWTKWYGMKFITGSYSSTLSLESAEYSRDLIRSNKFKILYPELEIKQDKDVKTNFRIVKKTGNGLKLGGNRFSTSVDATATGFHGHIILIDDPLNPKQAVSEVELQNANRFMDQTLSTRKTDKKVSTLILIMQRLHQNDPTGHLLAKGKANTKHISLPGEIINYYDFLQPKELEKYYKDGLFDSSRMDYETLEELKADLGQYGYAGQIGQNPVPPGGGMFKVDHFHVVDRVSEPNIVQVVRYWDKAGTDKKDAKKRGTTAHTVGTKIYKMANGKFIIGDVKRGQWASEEREKIIRDTAEADGANVKIYVEQEPGSGGKESVESTIRNLSGYACYADRPSGDKVYRADPYSVQVNNGNVWILRGDWNYNFIEEHRNFPFSITKDQVDSSSGAFSKLTMKKIARRII